MKRDNESVGVRDEIDSVLSNSGANNADLDRLAKVASEMQHLEWLLARRSHVKDAAPKGKL